MLMLHFGGLGGNFNEHIATLCIYISLIFNGIILL